VARGASLEDAPDLGLLAEVWAPGECPSGLVSAAPADAVVTDAAVRGDRPNAGQK